MALDTKQPKGYRKAWNGDQGVDGLREGGDKPIGWCRDERLRLAMDEIVEQTIDYTLVRCLANGGLHAGQWILWDGHGKCYAIGPEEWTRKMRDRLLEGQVPHD